MAGAHSEGGEQRVEGEIVIRAVGDLLFPSRYVEASGGLGDIDGLGLPAGATFGNLEVPLTEIRQPTSKFIAIRSDPEWVRALRDWQVTVVSLANNHLLDQGVDGAWETTRHLDEVGIAHSGFGANRDEALDPAWVAFPEGEIAFISAAAACPPAYASNDSMAGVAALRVATTIELTDRFLENPGQSPRVKTRVDERSLEPLLTCISRARVRAAAVVVSLHWGVPQQAALADYQQPLAHAVVDAGADVVVGHHPHVLQGVEIYRGRPILYSLGHLVCGADQVEALAGEIRGAVKRQWHLSAVARLRRSAEGAWDIEFLPVAIDETGTPRLPDAREADAVFETLSAASDEFGVEVRRDGGAIRVAAGDGHSEPAATAVPSRPRSGGVQHA